MPKTTYGECTFCPCGHGWRDDSENPVAGQHVYVYVDGKIKQAGFACTHCLAYYGLR